MARSEAVSSASLLPQGSERQRYLMQGSPTQLQARGCPIEFICYLLCVSPAHRPNRMGFTSTLPPSCNKLVQSVGPDTA
jgi:hypothetical protein